MLQIETQTNIESHSTTSGESKEPLNESPVVLFISFISVFSFGNQI